MRLRDQVVEQQVQTVIERGRQIRRAPDVVRARLLARARVAAAMSARATRMAIPETAPAWHGRRLAFAAAALLLLFSAAGATAALYVHARRSAEPAMRSVQLVPTTRRTPEAPSIVASARDLPAAETDPPPQLGSRPRLQRPSSAAVSPGVVRRGAVSAATGASRLRQPGFLRRAGAGRRARPQIPERTSGGGARGVAGAIARRGRPR